MKVHAETRFEDAIDAALIEQGGYGAGVAKLDPVTALFVDDVLAFIQASQPTRWEQLVSFQGPAAGDVLIDGLAKELAAKGALHVLRHGFKCFGKAWRLAFFRPNTSLNPQALEDYGKTTLRVHRQVRFSEKHPNQSVDVVLSVNGLPAVTVELKNKMTGQTVEHGKRQYKEDRDPREPLFRFKERALVHFAVDPDEAWMTTRLSGRQTRFLPFNRGRDHGTGNPPAAPGKYRTSYLWDEVLARDSLMDILARFLHLQVEVRQVPTAKGLKTERREMMIFPRYHQLDAVRRLVTHAGEHGSGRNYLIQHSAGSGKSNSIAWLAHRLASLHDAQDEKVFDTVVVITDRRVLDQQLQDTIYQFEHKAGVVQKIDENTRQLARALSTGVPIVISTIQKFPFISQAMDTLAKKGEAVAIETTGKRFAVVVDEAHSSQSGETAMELRKILNKEGIEAAIAAQILDGEDEEEFSEEAQKALMAEMLKRPRQPNLSFFAFTATPKFKTKVVFDEPGPDGLPPFHLYSMRQAIEEKFIHDVLANYTTYRTYCGLIKEVEGDPNVPKRKAAKALARFLSLHPHNIAQKVEVIVEHFRSFTRHRIGGQAKAMVVTGSRLHAVRYKLAFDRYVREKGYNDIAALVAFSGSVIDPDLPGQSFTEVGMNNGLKETELPERFAGEDYQILIVAEKYQTGFDQPLLHTMYVDKRLAGIQAVQTISRLNRTVSGKEGTFVLDFVNDREEIYRAFKPYYGDTPIGDEPDPHRLYELQHEVEEFRVFDASEVNAFCQIWFVGRIEPTAGDHQKLDEIIGYAIQRFVDLDGEKQEAFRGKLASFQRLYAFLAQIIPYQDSSLEKLYTYGRVLLAALPRDRDDDSHRIEDDVDLHYYRLQKISEGAINLSEGEADPLKGPTEIGTGRTEETEILLSELVQLLNERFGTDFGPADQLFFDQIEESAIQDEDLRAAARANTMENFAYVFERALERLILERMEGNEAIFTKIMTDDDFRSLAASELLRRVYERLSDKEES
jgi:type I restriction enzyme R subunit